MGESSLCSKSVPVWRVLQQWESYGISEGRALLQDLGLPHAPNDQLVMQDLLAAVEEECTSSSTSTVFSTGTSNKRHHDGSTNKRALCMLLLQETKHLRLVLYI